MHYIRLLRAPTLTREENRKHPWSLNVVFTVTTDLGDSFLTPDDNEPIKIKVSAGWDQQQPSKKQKSETMILAAEKVLRWTPGMRVLKADIPAQHLSGRGPLPSSNGLGPLRIRIRAEGDKSADTATSVNFAGFEGDCGKILPLWADVQTPGSEAPTTCVRRLQHGDRPSEAVFEIEEDIGESIARHIWDAGLMAVCGLWQVNTRESFAAEKHPWRMKKFHNLLFGNGPVNILELGCGVGILGNGLAQLLSPVDPQGEGSVLMTDLPEAEYRARANIKRLATSVAATVHSQYENLDWDDGRKGSFGPLVESKMWDVIVMSDCTYNVDSLPSLVNTWTAVHVHNLSKSTNKNSVQTWVYIAWKKRHPDENEFWNQVDSQGWNLQEEDVVELPVLGGETERIFTYLFSIQSTKFELDEEKGVWKCS
ncbi:hypothetical protein CORC01_11647 [Colletotrichum orchidophilum]|uniref:Methyltransferase domain-containing protein n=1 Tax=Colletotrichum orchidophilum TaxID=1209926 RepID=A0A1G4AV92_9PEZI|nr:uncharacterized protein CORC01_11647 [Colletotrichum orchidophilum]OHE93090.1 hypothetical protein CORC01_11647 [Colletotrichum orchidophilum]